MEGTLLATKFTVPPQRRPLLPRAHLFDLLEQEVPRHKLTLLCAPAGYGKTTLLAQWARSSSLAVGWVSLGVGDNELWRFLRYLLQAWQVIHPEISESRLQLLLSTQETAVEAVLAAFINAASELSEHTVFVLDDYHLIEDPAIHDALAFLLDHLPPALHFVLASRGEPSLPVARYRARQQLLELGVDELKFELGESNSFLNELMGLRLDSGTIASVHERLEGWIGGLQLAALTLQRGSGKATGNVVSGRHRHIADYLSEDVLAGLPADVQQFLLETSLLESLCAPLCEAVTGTSGAQEMLERLEQESLFLVPLDDERQWFRYHHLFADFLREQLRRRDEETLARLHRRAASWYLSHSLPEQVISHAVAGEDVDLVVQVFYRFVNARLLSGEIALVKQWIDALPTEWYDTHPVLGLARAGYLAYTGAFEACVRCVQEVEQKLAPADSDEARRQMARVTAVQTFLACMQNDLHQAETLAQRALSELPEDDIGFRPTIYGALGDTYRYHGRWEQAKQSYLEALQFADTPTVRVEAAHIFGALADLDLRQGHLRDAAAYWRRALMAMQEPHGESRLPLPVMGWIYVRLAEILYEWNELEEAWEHLSQGLELAELGGDVRSLIAGYLLAGRLQLVQGDVEAAAGYLELTRPLLRDATFPEWTAPFQRLQLALWLAQDRLRAAVHWSDEFLEENRPQGAHLAVVRLLLVKGDNPSLQRALQLLAPVLQEAEAEGREGRLIEALALQALIYRQQGDSVRALTSLERALSLAEPQGYVRLFVDLGRPMGRLLQEAHSRDVLPAYVQTLLEAFSPLPTSVEPVPLPEPLTPRELEVLELLAAGLTNREIGEELVISPQTVKKHTGNIYSKLGVGNRTEAASRARELDILGRG
jgi:LuxR family maltose regulon positive regulatory protein